MRRPSVCLLGVLGVAAIGVAGCGSGEGSKSSASAGSESSKSTPAYGSEYQSAASSSASSTATAGTGSVTVATKSSSVYGKVLAAGAQQGTVYMFSLDKGGSSHCNGTCTKAWPPVTTTAAPQAAGGVKASLLGTIKRSEGTEQVTYAGHPLYFYVADKEKQDVLGEGIVSFGGPWYMLSASGKVIKKP